MKICSLFFLKKHPGSFLQVPGCLFGVIFLVQCLEMNRQKNSGTVRLCGIFWCISEEMGWMSGPKLRCVIVWNLSCLRSLFFWWLGGKMILMCDICKTHVVTVKRRNLVFPWFPWQKMDVRPKTSVGAIFWGQGDGPRKPWTFFQAAWLGKDSL